MPVKTVLCNINRELLPGKEYYDPVHPSKIPNPSEKNTGSVLPLIDNHGCVNPDGYLFDTLCLKITELAFKGHEHRGRIENKLKQIALVVHAPMTKGNCSKVSVLDYDVITSSRL